MSKVKPNKPNKPNPNTQTGLPPGQEKQVYNSIIDMATSGSLRDRIAAAVAQEPNPPVNPISWAQERMWQFAALTDWVAAWDYAMNDDNKINHNPDTGRRTDVIGDNMILAAVQAKAQEA